MPTGNKGLAKRKAGRRKVWGEYCVRGFVHAGDIVKEVRIDLPIWSDSDTLAYEPDNTLVGRVTTTLNAGRSKQYSGPVTYAEESGYRIQVKL
jgi:hypothetical protein